MALCLYKDLWVHAVYYMKPNINIAPISLPICMHGFDMKIKQQISLWFCCRLKLSENYSSLARARLGELCVCFVNNSLAK